MADCMFARMWIVRDNLRKNLNRAGTSILQRTGVVDKTVDRDFEQQEGHFRTLRGKAEKLHRENKAYLDAVRAFSSTLERIIGRIATLIDEDTPETRQIRMYRQAAELLAQHGCGGFDEAYRATVLEPTTRFAVFFPQVEEVMKRRTNKLLDYDAARDRVHKAIERPSTDPEKLPRLEQEEQQAKRTYEELNQMLITGIPALISLRQSYLHPSLEALLMLQAKLMQDLARSMDAFRPSCTTDDDIEMALHELRQLTIVSI